MILKLSDIDILEIGNEFQLAGAIYASKDSTLLCWLPGAHETTNLPSSDLVMDRVDWERFLRQTDLMEVEVLARTADGDLVKAIVRKSNRVIDQHASWAVFKRDGYACRFCGRDDAPLTVDHLVRWEQGGPSIPENMVASCRKCNKIRGNMEYRDWLMSQEYSRVSNGRLTGDQKDANINLLRTLDAIPRKANARSR